MFLAHPCEATRMEKSVTIVATTVGTIAMLFGGFGWAVQKSGWGLFVAIAVLALVLKATGRV